MNGFMRGMGTKQEWFYTGEGVRKRNSFMRGMGMKQEWFYTGEGGGKRNSFMRDDVL